MGKRLKFITQAAYQKIWLSFNWIRLRTCNGIL